MKITDCPLDVLDSPALKWRRWFAGISNAALVLACEEIRKLTYEASSETLSALLDIDRMLVEQMAARFPITARKLAEMERETAKTKRLERIRTTEGAR